VSSELTSSVFQGFIDSASATQGTQDNLAVSFSNVAVLGGSLDGQLIAALCFAQGCQVNLFSAYSAELESMQSGIALQGSGPVGSYHVNQERGPSINAGAALDECLSGGEVIFLTGPVHKQRTYAMVLADHLRDGQVLVLPNARTFGAFEALSLLKLGGATADITLVEMQGLPYWYEKPHNALLLEEAGEVACACIPANRTHSVVEALSQFIPGLKPKTNVLQSSLADCSAVVDVPGLLLAGPALKPGGKPVPMGGVPLEQNNTFYNLIGEQQHTVIASLLAERCQVAARYGVRDLPDINALLQRQAGQASGAGARGVPGPQAAMSLLRDSAIGSLVPLMSAAQSAGVDVPVTQAMVQLCSTLLGNNVATSGRQLHSIGIEQADFDSVFQRMNVLSKAGL